jgi:hypothetical protein
MRTYRENDDRRGSDVLKSVAFLASVALALPAVAQVAAGGAAAPGGASPPGCQPGQVLMGNGDSCIPPVNLPAPVNALSLTPAEMSRMLAPSPAPVGVQPQCQAGQVLQPNGQPCVVPAVRPSALGAR